MPGLTLVHQPYDQTSAFQHIYTGLKLHLGINTKGCPIREGFKVHCIFGLY